MQPALDQFIANLERARGLTELTKSLAQLTTGAVDLTDIYRASLVHGVSALDQFVHEFARLGMLGVYRGIRPATDSHSSFRIPLSAAKAGIADTTNDAWLDQAIREAHSWQSFQHPDKIADAVRLISTVKLWEAVGTELGTSAKAVKTQLSVIVDRRNKIAHEADMDPTNPGHRWPIDEVLVSDALNFLEGVVRAIFRVA